MMSEEYLDEEFLDEEIGAGWVETNPRLMTVHESSMHVRQLIAEEVQSFPVLYDYSNPRYADRLAKGNAWAYISKKLNLEISDLKKKWTMMKAVYNKHKRGQPSGSGAVQEQVPEYVRTMRYLDVASSPRRTVSYPPQLTVPLHTQPMSPVLHSTPIPIPSANIPVSSSVSLPSVPTSCLFRDHSSNPQLSQSPNFFVSPNDRQSSVPIQPTRTSHSTSDNIFPSRFNIRPSPVQRNKRQKSEDAAGDSALIAALEETKLKYNPNEMFLLSWVGLMDKMSPAAQGRVRAQICQIFALPDSL